MKSKFKIAFILGLLLFMESCESIKDKYPGFEEKIRFSVAYWIYWFKPVYEKIEPNAIYEVGEKTKYEIWKCKENQDYTYVVFPTIRDGGLRFTLTFTGNVLLFSDADFFVYPPYRDEKPQPNQGEIIKKGFVDLSGEFSEIIIGDNKLSEVEIKNLKAWLNKYLIEERIKGSQHFYVISNEKYFDFLDVYWPAKKVAIEVPNDLKDFEHLPQVEKIRQFSMNGLDSKKKMQ